MKRASQFVYLVGGYQICTRLWSTARSWYNLDFCDVPLEQRLRDLYGGDGEWALITGASEGIGKQYALELAKAGFNIKICARSLDKLEAIAEQAKRENPTIKAECVKLDVSTAQPCDYANLFTSPDGGQLRTSIVVNNAGIMKNRLFMRQDPAVMEAMIKTNLHPYVYMAKYAIQNFLENKGGHGHRNALTFTSSSAAYGKIPFFGVYASTKAHNAVLGSMVAQSLRKSDKTKQLVDVQTVHPGAVSTGLISHAAPGGHIATAQECAKGALSDLGNNNMAVAGALAHATLVNAMPKKVYSP